MDDAILIGPTNDVYRLGPARGGPSVLPAPDRAGILRFVRTHAQSDSSRGSLRQLLAARDVDPKSLTDDQVLERVAELVQRGSFQIRPGVNVTQGAGGEVPITQIVPEDAPAPRVELRSSLVVDVTVQEPMAPYRDFALDRVRVNASPLGNGREVRGNCLPMGPLRGSMERRQVVKPDRYVVSLAYEGDHRDLYQMPPPQEVDCPPGGVGHLTFIVRPQWIGFHVVEVKKSGQEEDLADTTLLLTLPDANEVSPRTNNQGRFIIGTGVPDGTATITSVIKVRPRRVS